MFVSGMVHSRSFETAAYRAASGARLWAKPYWFGNPTAITVSPDGVRVYVTGRTQGDTGAYGGATVAYDTRTGRQLWAHKSAFEVLAASGLAVSPDGATVYAAGFAPDSSRHEQFAVSAYAAATGKQRWQRHYSEANFGAAESVAVGADGKTVYVTGSVSTGPIGPYSVLTVAYSAAGTVKWATRYKDPYADGSAGGDQVVAGPGNAVYVVGSASNKAGHSDVATFAYSAVTGRKLWMDRYNAYNAGGTPGLAVTPSGQAVIVTVPRHGGHSDYAIASYNATTGATRWTRLAPGQYMMNPYGLVIDSRGDTMFVGSGRTAAYSVSDGSVLWTTSASDVIGRNPDGTRVFGIVSGTRATKIVAYRA